MKQAVILVGGRGTRLGAITLEFPKPLLPIEGDKRFLDFLMETVARRGFTSIVLIAGYLGEQVFDRYNGRRLVDAQIEVIIEPVAAGTAGALRYAEALLDETFLLMNGDSLFNFDYQALETVLAPNDLGVLALRKIEDARRYGTVVYTGSQVVNFREKDEAHLGWAYISSGVYCLRRQILEEISDLPFSIETQVFPSLANRGKLSCSTFEGYFIDIGLPHTLDQSRRDLPKLAYL